MGGPPGQLSNPESLSSIYATLLHFISAHNWIVWFSIAICLVCKCLPLDGRQQQWLLVPGSRKDKNIHQAVVSEVVWSNSNRREGRVQCLYFNLIQSKSRRVILVWEIVCKKTDARSQRESTSQAWRFDSMNLDAFVLMSIHSFDAPLKYTCNTTNTTAVAHFSSDVVSLPFFNSSNETPRSVDNSLDYNVQQKRCTRYISSWRG